MSDATDCMTEETVNEGDLAIRPRLMRASFVFLVLVAWTAISVWAQGLQRDVHGNADGVPLSNQLYFLEIHFDSGERARVGAREGTLVTIRNEERYLGFAVKEGSAADSQVDPVRVVDVFQIRQLPPNVGGESVHQIDVSKAYGDDFVQFDSAAGLDFDVRIVGVEERSFRTPFYSQDEVQPLNAPSLSLIAEFDEQCCAATCDGKIICGSSVDTFCSSCCSGEACRPSGGLNQNQ